MKLNEEIQRLRADGSGPEAKGRVIAILQEKQRHKTMKLIGKLSIPAALVAAVAIGGMLSIPRTALASPSTVAKAIRDIKNYVINSFTIVDGKRSLTSKTTVVDGKLSRQFFDANGKPVAEGSVNALDGTMFNLAVDTVTDGGKHIRTFEGGPGLDVKVIDGDKLGEPGVDVKIVPGTKMGTGEKSIQIKAEKGPDGKLVKKYFVDGKEVKELPAGIKGQVGILRDPSGKDIEKVMQGHHIEIGSALKSGDVVRGGFMVLEGNENGDVTQFASGQTSADYLLKLLEDPTRWTIARGVVFNGQKLDKFMLKGPISPIELYVDPQTSLPKVLKFVGPAEGLAPKVEDEYVYGAIPPK